MKEREKTKEGRGKSGRIREEDKKEGEYRQGE